MIHLGYFFMLFHLITLSIYSLLFPDAAEDTTETKSDDDPQCVVHYPELMSGKPSRIILLSDRSYGKLIESRNIRMELGDKACQDQCETIPVPNYDSKRDGYHRPCYMKFIKIKIEDIKSPGESCTDDQNKTQAENCSGESKIQLENCSDQCRTEYKNNINQGKAEQENHSAHSHDDKEISPENQSKVWNEDYSGDSKIIQKSFTEQSINENGDCSNGSMNENENQCENCSGIQCETVDEDFSDHNRKLEHRNCYDPSNRMKHKDSENHCITKHKDHNGFQNE